MYINKNYEWMQDWEAPRDKNFIFDFFAYLYWMYMFNKLRAQGTQKDRLRLAEIYDESVEKEISFGASIFDKNTSFYYRRTVTTFIYETRQKAMDDDIEKQRMIDKENFERQWKENDIAIHGCDRDERNTQEALYEIELDEAGKNDPERYAAEPMPGNKYLRTFPKFETAITQKVVNELNITTLSGIGIHARVFDRVKGYFTAIVWADNRPKDANGKQTCVYLFSPHYAGLDGIMDQARFEMDLEKIRALTKNFDKKKKEKKRREVTEDDIDISNVTAALGMDGNDDLNGDIF